MTLNDAAALGNVTATETAEHGANGTHLEAAYNALVAAVRDGGSGKLSHLEAAAHALNLALRDERAAKGRDPETGARLPRA